MRLVQLLFPVVALIWHDCVFAEGNRDYALGGKLEVRPPVIWPAKQGSAMKVSSALQPSSKDVRESLHPMVDKFDWLTPDRLVTPPRGNSWIDAWEHFSIQPESNFRANHV